LGRNNGSSQQKRGCDAQKPWNKGRSRHNESDFSSGEEGLKAQPNSSLNFPGFP
jgi:hypothetical protein